MITDHYTKEALNLGPRTRNALCMKLDKDFKEVARYTAIHCLNSRGCCLA